MGTPPAIANLPLCGDTTGNLAQTPGDFHVLNRLATFYPGGQGDKSAPPWGAGGDLGGDSAGTAESRPLGLLIEKLAAIEKLKVLQTCGKHAEVHRHEKGLIAHDVGCPAKVMIAYRCKNKWCPSCYGYYAKVAQKRIALAAEKFRWPVSCNLTISNYKKGKLAEMWKFLDESFRRLRRSKFWQNTIDDCIAIRGLTYNLWESTWHAHIHLILGVKNFVPGQRRRGWLPKWKFLEQWNIATRGQGKRAGEPKRTYDVTGEAAHVMKGTKGDLKKLLDLVDCDPEALQEAVFVMLGKQRVWTCCQTRLPRKPETEAYCPVCESRFVWSEWNREFLPLDVLYKRIRGAEMYWFSSWARAPGVDLPPVGEQWGVLAESSEGEEKNNVPGKAYAEV